MGAFVTDDFAGPLATALKSIDVGRTVEQTLDLSVQDAEEVLKERLPLEIRQALTTLDSSPGTRMVGIPEDSPAYPAAHDYEYGSLNHEEPPHRVFSLYEIEWASSAAKVFTGAIQTQLDQR